MPIGKQIGGIGEGGMKGQDGMRRVLTGSFSHYYTVVTLINMFHRRYCLFLFVLKTGDSNNHRRLARCGV